MDLFLLLGSLLSTFAPLLIIGLIIWAIYKGTRHSPPPVQLPSIDVETQLRRRDQEWVTFIESYAPELASAKEKKLLHAILSDATSQGRGYSVLVQGQTVQAATVIDRVADEPMVPDEVIIERQPTDNAAILLYLGAFMFVASVGLFVAFADANGPLRTLAILIVMGVMYASGLWLYDTKPRLRQAGLAFAGIGIVIAPLVGLAAYSYVFDRQHGAVVWAVTSIFCLGLYLHALKRLQYSLIGYLLIFTLLSLFESGVSIIDAPIYYFGWGLAFVGLLLQLLTRYDKTYQELREPSRNGSSLMLPLSLLTAVALTPTHGVIQLAVSLALAALYYGLEASRSQGSTQASNAALAHVAATAAMVSGIYGVSNSWTVTALGLIILNLLQLVASSFYGSQNQLWRNFDSVVLWGSVASCLAAIGNPAAICASLLATTVIGIVLWYRSRVEAFVIGGLSYLSLPIAYGQYLLSPQVTPAVQTMFSLLSLIGFAAIGLVRFRKALDSPEWSGVFNVIFLLGLVITLGWSAFAGPIWCLAVTLLVGGLCLIVAGRTKTADWVDVTALVLFLPLLRVIVDRPVFLMANIIVLAVLTGLSLRYRRESLRWGATLAWLSVPLGFGLNQIGGDWTAASYAWAYLLVALCLLLCRAIARGVVLVSGTIPLTAYARSASLSYVFGYGVAATLSVCLSLGSDQSRLHTSLLLAVYAGLILLVANVIEKRTTLLALLPLLAQGLLLSLMRPANDSELLILYLVLSSSLAIVSYVYAQPCRRTVAQSAVVTTFVAPLSLFFVGRNVWMMAVGLLVAGIIVCHYVRHRSQSDREAAGLIITAAVLWLLGIAGLGQVQAYTHVIILNLALYAYWRHIRGEPAMVDQYIYGALFMATVPLSLQALGGQGGGLYGWWLLLEMVAVMLIGMAIKRRFVVMWGLYVTVGAVLYQLRNLGWAALTVLAMFLIGLAVYQLQKHDKQR